jgi:hypothetical protein
MRLRLSVAIFAFVALIATARAPAQPLFLHDVSLECTVTNADTVIVGVVEEVVKGPEFTGVTIAVEETLKGEHRDRVQVNLPAAMASRSRTDSSARVLVALRADAATGASLIDLAGRGPEVLTADFRVLKQPDDLVHAARAAIRQMPGVRRVETFPRVVPFRVVAGTRWEKVYGSGGYALLEVPADERLAEWALRATLSKSVQEREEGARALRFFRSDANVERVRSLLADPTWAHGHRAEDNLGNEVRVYTVRQAAYNTLTYWGVKADKPLIREELWLPEKVQLIDLSNQRVPDVTLDGLVWFENLEDLSLRNEPLTDARLKHLAGLVGLRSLDLGGTQVTDAGLHELAGMTALRHLSLRGTKVTGTGLRELTVLKALESLDLTQTAITDASLEHVAGLPGLKTIDLSGTNVSANAVSGLIKLRPGLKVIR